MISSSEIARFDEAVGMAMFQGFIGVSATRHPRHFAPRQTATIRRWWNFPPSTNFK